MQQFTFPYQQSLKSHLPEAIQQLITAAETATDKAYAPYSNFKVGAALVQQDGTVLTGANHENAAFPAGICAERALFGGLDMGSGNKVIAIAIAYKTDRKEAHPPPVAMRHLPADDTGSAAASTASDRGIYEQSGR